MKRAIILLRHGQDFRKIDGVKESTLWEHKCSDANEDGAAICNRDDKWEYSFKDPKAKNVVLPWRRLNDEGRKQAIQLSLALPRWLGKNGYYSISRVVTKDPRSTEGTQNPFQTVYPLVKELEKNGSELPYVRFKFMDTIPDKELKYDELIDKRGNYSTIICWDCQGLWGEKIKNDKGEKIWPPSPAKDSVFKRLIPGKVTGVPGKGEDLYIVTYDSHTKSFSLADHVKLSDLVKNNIVDTDDTEKTAIVILRHGDDLDSWIEAPEVESGLDDRINAWRDNVNSEWPKYLINNSTTIGLLQHGLSPDGEAQAIGLGEKLTEFLKGKCADISRVVTKDPTIITPDREYSKPTPNPFDTVYPIIKEYGLPTDLIAPAPSDGVLIDPDLQKMIDNESIYPSNGSTLLCWDAEGLWGPKIKVEGQEKKVRLFNENSILAKLSKHYLRDINIISDYPPKKGKTIYIFTENECNIYRFSFENKSFSGPTTLKGSITVKQ